MAQWQRDEGKREGMLLGEAKGKLEAASGVLSLGLSPEQVVKALDLPFPDVQALTR